jgi:hypothetical protein
MDGWMDGRESGVKDCLQQSKTLLEEKSVIVELGVSQPRADRVMTY